MAKSRRSLQMSRHMDCEIRGMGAYKDKSQMAPGCMME